MGTVGNGHACLVMAASPVGSSFPEKSRSSQLGPADGGPDKDRDVCPFPGRAQRGGGLGAKHGKAV